MKTPFAVSLLATLALVAGCSKKAEQDHDHEHAAAPHEHVHVAPHGGTLVPLDGHAYNVELVRDADAGKLIAYILDAHAENFIRITTPGFEVVAISNGERRPLTLRAIANQATGETVGDTSQFEAQADWIKQAKPFAGEITALDLRGNKFERVTFQLR
jgi:hypothetical protein